MRRRIQGYGRRIARKFRFSAEKFESSLMHSIIKCAITFHYLSNYPLLCNLHLPSGYCSLIFHLPKTLNLSTINWEKPLSRRITLKTLIKPSLYIQTLYLKPTQMASSSRRPSGKRPRESSGVSLPISAVSLVPPARVEIFNKDIGKRGVVPQHAFYKLTAERMQLVEILNLLQYQGIVKFLECNAKYSEDLVRVFYTCLHDKFCGQKFHSRIGTRKVSFKSVV